MDFTTDRVGQSLTTRAFPLPSAAQSWEAELDSLIPANASALAQTLITSVHSIDGTKRAQAIQYLLSLLPNISRSDRITVLQTLLSIKPQELAEVILPTLLMRWDPCEGHLIAEMINTIHFMPSNLRTEFYNFLEQLTGEQRRGLCQNLASIIPTIMLFPASERMSALHHLQKAALFHGTRSSTSLMLNHAMEHLQRPSMIYSMQQHLSGLMTSRDAEFHREWCIFIASTVFESLPALRITDQNPLFYIAQNWISFSESSNR